MFRVLLIFSSLSIFLPQSFANDMENIIWSASDKKSILETLNIMRRHEARGTIERSAGTYDPVALMLAGYQATKVYTFRDSVTEDCMVRVEFDNDSNITLEYEVFFDGREPWVEYCRN